MTNIRIERTTDLQALPSDIFHNKQLKLEDAAIFAFLMSENLYSLSLKDLTYALNCCPDESVFSEQENKKQLIKEAFVLKALKRLEAVGYARSQILQNKRTQEYYIEYVVFDQKQPLPENPYTDESIENKGSHPRPGNPDTDNPEVAHSEGIYTNLKFNLNRSQCPENTIGDHLTQKQKAILINKVNELESLPQDFSSQAVSQIEKYILSTDYFTESHSFGFKEKLKAILDEFCSDNRAFMMSNQINLNKNDTKNNKDV